MSTNFKNPPVFGEQTYEQWKSELKIWELMTEMDVTKRALAVILTLKGRARTCALNCEIEQLNSENGMDTLLRALDDLFLQETIDKAFQIYKEFDDFRRPENMAISDYIAEFDQRYRKSEKYKMVLPEAVLACKLLANSGLKNEQRQLALTACASGELSYSKMKSAMKRIFGDIFKDQTDSFIEMREEAALLTRHNGTTHRRHFEKSRHVDRQHGNSEESDVRKKGNPFNVYGRQTRCKICQSTLHYWKECQHRKQSVEITESCTSDEDEEKHPEECNITLFTHGKRTENENFVHEMQKCAVIDTGCTRTVCGKRWLRDYLKTIKSTINSKRSHKPFRFGNGKTIYSFKKVVIPAVIADTRCKIEIEILDINIPLILSKTSLKKANGILDLKNDYASLFGRPVKLKSSDSGHYFIEISSDKERKTQEKMRCLCKT